MKLTDIYACIFKDEFKELYQKMKALIEETYRINNNTRVILLAHSMGNPTSLYFYNQMSQAWKDKYLEAHISLAGVWVGAIKPLRLFASGMHTDFNLKKKKSLN